MLYRDGATVVPAFEASDGDKLRVRVRVIAQVETLVESTGSRPAMHAGHPA